MPTSGTGTFDGTMLATMVFNDQPDITGNRDTYMQWIAGNASTSVNFGANTFSLSLDGSVGAPTFDGTSGQHSVLEGARFLPMAAATSTWSPQAVSSASSTRHGSSIRTARDWIS
ncbi:hypothetical protein [Sphingopyxis sp. BSNA05]|uniref:hypothetical protein n=1 Tax=Sphingopyxis sp. BSNA05 TaxID=1236614 RepID=UPI0015633528|nr:hypothetical protein [Sphingopyxis sp. BSNA05]